jgi:hypothetical protein
VLFFSTIATGFQSSSVPVHPLWDRQTAWQFAWLTSARYTVLLCPSGAP